MIFYKLFHNLVMKGHGFRRAVMEQKIVGYSMKGTGFSTYINSHSERGL